jgi:membrane protein YdbS with pleckstrin-like domain
MSTPPGLPNSFSGTPPFCEMNPSLPAALEPPSDQPIGAATQPFGELPATLGPDRSLLTYYALQSLLFGPFFFFALIPLYFRFRSMRYEVDEEGITMSWGVLFRREISLTFARIQDIHLSSNVVQRWLGLASIQIQTASGSATAEMTVEGLPQYEAVRDFFYARMRGANKPAPTNLPAPADVSLSPAVMDELTDTLREIAMEVRLLRQAVRPSTAENSDA